MDCCALACGLHCLLYTAGVIAESGGTVWAEDLKDLKLLRPPWMSETGWGVHAFHVSLPAGIGLRGRPVMITSREGTFYNFSYSGSPMRSRNKIKTTEGPSRPACAL